MHQPESFILMSNISRVKILIMSHVCLRIEMRMQNHMNINIFTWKNATWIYTQARTEHRTHRFMQWCVFLSNQIYLGSLLQRIRFCIRISIRRRTHNLYNCTKVPPAQDARAQTRGVNEPPISRSFGIFVWFIEQFQVRLVYSQQILVWLFCPAGYLGITVRFRFSSFQKSTSSVRSVRSLKVFWGSFSVRFELNISTHPWLMYIDWELLCTVLLFLFPSDDASNIECMSPFRCYYNNNIMLRFQYGAPSEGERKSRIVHAHSLTEHL